MGREGKGQNHVRCSFLNTDCTIQRRPESLNLRILPESPSMQVADQASNPNLPADWTTSNFCLSLQELGICFDLA